jgi:hypothetical protein
MTSPANSSSRQLSTILGLIVASQLKAIQTLWAAAITL